MLEDEQMTRFLKALKIFLADSEINFFERSHILSYLLRRSKRGFRLYAFIPPSRKTVAFQAGDG